MPVDEAAPRVAGLPEPAEVTWTALVTTTTPAVSIKIAKAAMIRPTARVVSRHPA